MLSACNDRAVNADIGYHANKNGSRFALLGEPELPLRVWGLDSQMGLAPEGDRRLHTSWKVAATIASLAGSATEPCQTWLD